MEEHSERAAAAGTANGSRKAHPDGQQLDNTNNGPAAQFAAHVGQAGNSWVGPPPDQVTYIRAQIGGCEGVAMTFKGRSAWALAHLIAAGTGGLTTLERPAPRWSHYLWLLRRAGLVIDRQDEAHSGPYSGHHGRYRLQSHVQILEAA